jgi:hypothetical protein
MPAGHLSSGAPAALACACRICSLLLLLCQPIPSNTLRTTLLLLQQQLLLLWLRCIEVLLYLLLWLKQTVLLLLLLLLLGCGVTVATADACCRKHLACLTGDPA